MKLIRLYCQLAVFLFFSCGEGKEEKKELSGPHAEIQLFITNSFHTSIHTPGDSLHIFQIPENKTVNDFYSVLMQSDTLLKKTLIRLGRKGTDAEIESIRENMKFFTVDKTDILQIEVYSEEQKFACAFLDTLVHTFNEEAMIQLHEESRRKVKLITGQIDSVAVKLHEAEDYIRENREILNLRSELDLYFNEYTKLKTKEELINELKNCLNHDFPDCLEKARYYFIGDDEFLSATLTKLYNLNVQKNSIQCPTAGNEACKKLDEEIKEYLSNLNIYLKNVLSSIDAQRKQFEGYMKKLPETQDDILREYEINQKMYAFLIEKKTELMIGMAGIVSPIRMVDRARWNKD